MRQAIPDAALEQHIAILGKTGSGKTYAAKGVVEGILSAGGRVCIIDPTGAWHGLRSSATGKSAGFPVVIFGGSHADLPLGGAHGEALAEIIGTASTPAIIDTSLMRVGERVRFFADFADALVRKNKGPLHLVIDEAHLFAPQGKVSDPQSGAMLHAANNLVSLGRSRGLRIILITQRPAKLHKDSLTQVETLVALRLIAPQDRGAVEDWIKDNADEKQGREIIQSLATLKTGHGWVWAPELGVLERVAFPKIKTFDSSAAPGDEEAGAGPVLAPIDRDAIAKRLETVAADAIANDPTRLKAEITKLRREMATAGQQKQEIDPKAIEDADRAGYERGFKEGAEATKAVMLPKADAVIEAVHVLRVATLPAANYRPGFSRPSSVPQHSRSALRPPMPRAKPVGTNGHRIGEMLPKGERACLIAVSQYQNGVRREQLTVLTGYKRSSRDAYIQRLRERGYIEHDGERIVSTDQGITALGSDYDPLPTGDALRERVLGRLPEGEKRVLEILIARYPEEVDRADIDEETGYQRSSRDAYLQRLSARELVASVGRGAVKAAADLFD